MRKTKKERPKTSNTVFIERDLHLQIKEIAQSKNLLLYGLYRELLKLGLKQYKEMEAVKCGK